MIRIVYGDELANDPQLRDSMHKDRAIQFKDRLKWDVCVDENGMERDEYDDLNPIYVIYQMVDGTHGGSVRFLPTTGQTMVDDHFSHLTDGVRIESPLIWECTRFCISPRAGIQDSKTIAAALMIASCEMGLQFGASDSIGVFDKRMIRIYRRIGWEPTILGTDNGRGKDKISVGIWELSEEVCDRMCKNAGIDRDVPKGWLDGAFRSTGAEVSSAA